MHLFKFKENRLYCEGVSVESLARKFQTPFYLYSHGTIVDHFEKIKKAFAALDPVICFSMKANSNLAVCSTLVRRGSGLDIVSGGELYKALKVHCPPERIVYASVGKKEDEIRTAVRSGILLFNVESEPELRAISSIAVSMGRRVDVALRLNPDVEAKTHKYITTGKSENKFGLDLRTAYGIFKARSRYPGVRLSGVHVHIGSQITESAPFIKAVKRILAFVDSLDADIRFFNIGGGLGIIYDGEVPQTAAQFASRMIPLFKGRELKLILEPGRFIAGNSGILVTKIVYIKTGAKGKKFAIVDAGMNDLIRPSLYEAYHQIVPVNRHGGKRDVYDVVGPICESGDFLGKQRAMTGIKQGDHLAVMSAGAYGYTMSSNYNSRPRVKEMMVAGKKAYVVKKAETYGDLIRGEVIPKGI